jgi:hypothetical protein
MERENHQHGSLCSHAQTLHEKHPIKDCHGTLASQTVANNGCSPDLADHLFGVLEDHTRTATQSRKPYLAGLEVLEQISTGEEPLSWCNTDRNAWLLLEIW